MNGAQAYFKEQHAHHLRQYADSITQFSLRDITEIFPQGMHEALVSQLIGNAAFSFKGPVPNIKIPFYCVIAFPPASKFHLGYASVLKEAELWIQHGAKPIIILSSCEATARGVSYNELNDRISYSKDFLEGYFSTGVKPQIIVDRETKEFQELELEVQGKINIAKLHQLMGKPAEGENLSYYRIPSLMVTTFLLAGKLAQDKEASVVIPLGMNEITYTELTKQVARKIGAREPTFVFRGQINDITAQARMSSKSPEKALHIDEDISLLAEKLRKSVTNAVQPIEGNIDTGRPAGCHFLRLVSALDFMNPDITATYLNCAAGGKCKDCKETVINHLRAVGT